MKPRRALVLVLALAACKADRAAPPPAPDAAQDLAVRFAWPDGASARVYETITVPSGTVYEPSFLLDAASGAVTLGDLDGSILPSAQWLMSYVKSAGEMQFTVTPDGALAGTTLLDDTRARTDDLLAHPPPTVSDETLAKLRMGAALVTTSPELPATITNHLSDLWIPWVGVWAAAKALPAPGATRTVTAFGLTFTLRTLAIGATVRVEAVTDRHASTQTDNDGYRSWFLPSGPPMADLSMSYHLVITAELDPATLLPREVTLDVREDDPDRPKPRKWSYSYRFDWV